MTMHSGGRTGPASSSAIASENVLFRAPYRFSSGAIAPLTKTVIQPETTDGVVGPGE